MSRHSTLRLLTLILTIPLCALASYANEGDCFGYPDLEAATPIVMGIINEGAPRVNFVKNAGSAKGCPSNDASCREKGYLVPGDQVIVSTARPDFVCVDYINAKGLDRAGWLPRAAIIIQPNEQTPRQEDWLGRWTGPEQSVVIEKGTKSGEVTIKGEASFGSLDPVRVKNGAVNTGEIEAVVKPDGSSLAFTVGDGRTLPYQDGDEYDCRVRMRRLGPFLLVKDNNNCGGMNVSFSGAYRRTN